MNIFWITYIAIVILNIIALLKLYNNAPNEIQKNTNVKEIINSSLIWIILPIVNILFFTILMIGIFGLKNNNR